MKSLAQDFCDSHFALEYSKLWCSIRDIVLAFMMKGVVDLGEVSPLTVRSIYCHVFEWKFWRENEREAKF